MGAGLEPTKQYGKPFRRDPEATEIRFQANRPYIVATLPKWRTTLKYRPYGPEAGFQVFGGPRIYPEKKGYSNASRGIRQKEKQEALTHFFLKTPARAWHISF